MATPERNLAVRIVLHYLVTFAVMALFSKLFPEIQQFLASTAIAYSDGGNELRDAFQSGVLPVEPILQPTGLFNDRALALLISLFSTVIFTVPLAWTFSLSQPTEQYSSIRETIFLLPITVASVVVIVQHSIALAFSLAGIVAAVRFRSNIKTPADAMFVFAALAIGLAAGVSEIAIAGIGSMFFCLTYIALRMTGVVHDLPAAATARPSEKPKAPIAGTAADGADTVITTTKPLSDNTEVH